MARLFKRSGGPAALQKVAANLRAKQVGGPKMPEPAAPSPAPVTQPTMRMEDGSTPDPVVEAAAGFARASSNMRRRARGQPPLGTILSDSKLGG